MSLQLLQNTSAMAPNLTAPFSATGGVPAYTWSVLPGGAGGAISSSGLYTSPSTYGIDTIQVTDASSSVATATMLVGTYFQLVCDIIQTSLGLSPGRVYVYNQKIPEPQDSALYIVVSILSCKQFSSTNQWDGSGSGLNSNQSVNMQAMLSLDIKSRSTQARDMKELVVMALNSIYSEQQQEFNSFRVFNVSPNIQDLSELDGMAIPYHFNITCNIQYFISNITAAPYFSSFGTPTVATNT